MWRVSTPTWATRFEGMYGYDPKGAKRLLAEAGYPKGFKAKAWLYQFARAPELIPWLESVAIQLREVGIELELEEPDLVAVIQPMTREMRANWRLRVGPPSKETVEPQIALFNAGKGGAHMFETNEIYKMWEDLLQISDPAARDAQLRKFGDHP